jgi:hypothetical protein
MTDDPIIISIEFQRVQTERPGSYGHRATAENIGIDASGQRWRFYSRDGIDYGFVKLPSSTAFSADGGAA